MSRLGKSVDDYLDGVKLAPGERQTHIEIYADIFPFLGRNTQRLQQSSMPHVSRLDPLTHVALHNIAISLALHTSPPELCLQIMIHLCAAPVDGIFVSVSFIKYLLVQPMVLWNHYMILELESAFLIHTKTVDLRVNFGQSPLDMRDFLITTLSCNDFPSQHQGEGHIILRRDRRYSNTRFFPNDINNRQVVAVRFAAQGIRNHIRFTGVIVILKIIVLDQLQPSLLCHMFRSD
jgi:hypothetical protein